VITNVATELSYDELLTENSDLKRTVLLLSHQLQTLQRGTFGKRSEKLSQLGISLPLFPEDLPAMAP